MIRLILSLKREHKITWKFISYINQFFFKLIYHKSIKKNALDILHKFENEKYTYRFLNQEDLNTLFSFLHDQDLEQFKYFKPHNFDLVSINKVYKNPSNFLFGVFDDKKLIGYFFLRCFVNKMGFIGRIVDESYQGQGIGKKMAKILYHITWSSDFRVFSTISKYNISSLKSHQAINNYRIVSELKNNYYLLEYLRSEEKPLSDLNKISRVRIAIRIDAISITNLHVETLPNSFLSGVSVHFLTCIYKFLIDHEYLCVYEEDDQVLGFVSFTPNTSKMMKRFVFYNFDFAISLFLKTIIKPEFMKKLLETFLAPFKSTKSTKSTRLPKGELLSISVSPNCQASGIGSQMVKALEEYLKQNKITTYKVVAGEELIGANKFYLKNGFVLANQIRIHGEKLSNVYVKKI